MPRIRRPALLILLALLAGCATLGQAIVPPTFEVARDRAAELRLLAPSMERPLGGAAVRLWARVENPNPLGLTLTRLTGELALQGARAAEVDFPLGVPLPAGGDALVPLDIVVGLADVPGLADAARRAATGQPIGYRLDGRFTVDAGVLGQPSFGPETLLTGELVVR